MYCDSVRVATVDHSLKRGASSVCQFRFVAGKPFGNADQKIVYSDGTSWVEDYHWQETIYPTAIGSKVWLDDVKVFLRDIVAHVEGSAFADQVVGYNPALLHGGEWFEYGSMYGKTATIQPRPL